MHRYKTQTSTEQARGEETGILAANVKRDLNVSVESKCDVSQCDWPPDKSWVLSTILVHLCAADVVVCGSDDP